VPLWEGMQDKMIKEMADDDQLGTTPKGQQVYNLKPGGLKATKVVQKISQKMLQPKTWLHEPTPVTHHKHICNKGKLNEKDKLRIKFVDER